MDGEDRSQWVGAVVIWPQIFHNQPIMCTEACRPSVCCLSYYQPVQPRQEAHLYIKENNQELQPSSLNNLIRMVYVTYGADSDRVW